jgi:hypothetical protein
MIRWRPIREKSPKPVTGDVLSWAERVWKETGRGKRKKALLAGVRTVTGEVLRNDGRLITLKVLKAARLASVYGPVELPKNGETIKRKLETIVKGAGHRMLWSDVAVNSTSVGESARAIVASIFLGPEPAAPPKAAVSPRPAYSRRGSTGAGRGRGPKARPPGR